MHSDLDADQMDYLIRDSVALGIGYGNFDLDFLVECMVRPDDLGTPQPEDAKGCLRFQEKALRTIEHYLLAKYYYFVQILSHKTRFIFEYAAQRVMEKMLAAGLGFPANYDEACLWVKEAPEKFYAFDDHMFWFKMREGMNGPFREERDFIRFANMLERRTGIPKLVFEKFIPDSQKENLRDEKKNMEAVAEKLEGEHRKVERFEGKTKIILKGREGREPGECIYITRKNWSRGDQDVFPFDDVEDSLIQKLVKERFAILRAYDVTPD